MTQLDLSARHPATQNAMKWFTFAHLPSGDLRDISKMSAILAEDMVVALPDGPQLSTGLRKLLEAKDCFVRAAIEKRDA